MVLVVLGSVDGWRCRLYGDNWILVIPYHTLPQEEQQKLQFNDSDDHVETQYFKKSNIVDERTSESIKSQDPAFVDDFDLEDNTEVGKVPEELGIIEVVDAQVGDAKLIKQVDEISIDGFASKSNSQLSIEELQLHSKQLRVLFDIGVLIQRNAILIVF